MIARTIIWVVGVNFGQGEFELPGFYVFVHLTCWLQNIWIHIYDMVLERWQRASRGVRCTALCRRSIFNRRWVCTWLIDQFEIALGTGSVFCQIAPWDCFGDECCPSFPRNFVIVNERRKWYSYLKRVPQCNSIQHWPSLTLKLKVANAIVGFPPNCSSFNPNAPLKIFRGHTNNDCRSCKYYKCSNFSSVW